MRIKKALSILLAVITVGSMISCSAISPPQELDEVYDRVVYLLEGSQDLNSLFFGEGIPTYEHNSEIQLEDGAYQNGFSGNTETASYASRYKNTDKMKIEAEKIYSIEYLSSLYSSIFGNVSGESYSGKILYARFTDSESGVMQSTEKTVFVRSRRIYDYSSMRIESPSDSEYMNISIDSYLQNKPEEKIRLTLSFKKESGDWYLSSPSY